MLHAVKRHVNRASAPLRSAPNAQFADLRQRLSSIKSSLKYTLDMLAAANRNWILQIQHQRRFSERFAEAYPTVHDNIHHVALQFANGSQVLYDSFIRDTSPHIAAYERISHQILLYIKEIDAVEARYSKLAMAKSEAERYQSKLDSMERSKKPTDPVKKSRNLQKMDNERDAYKKLLAETIIAQKDTYAKHPIVFKAALTAYWLSHEKHVTLLVQSLEQTQVFAKQAEQEMLQLDITSWVPSRDINPNNNTYLEHNPSVISDDEQDDDFHSATTVPVQQSKRPTKITVESPIAGAGPSNVPPQRLPVPEEAFAESPTSVVNTIADRHHSEVSRKNSKTSVPSVEGRRAEV